MAAEKKPSAREELLRIARKHQKRVMALSLRFQATPTLPLLPTSTPATAAMSPRIIKFSSNLERSTTTVPATVLSTSPPSTLPSTPAPIAITPEAPYAAPKQLQLTQDALSDLIAQLEKDPEITLMITPDDLSRLKTCSQALLAASYHCLYQATKMSCTSEESSWVGSGGLGVARTATGAVTNRNTFLERDWANGRLYYEAHYIFRLGLEDVVAFMKTEPSTLKLYASLDQSLKDLKHECGQRG